MVIRIEIVWQGEEVVVSWEPCDLSVNGKTSLC